MLKALTFSSLYKESAVTVRSVLSTLFTFSLSFLICFTSPSAAIAPPPPPPPQPATLQIATLQIATLQIATLPGLGSAFAGTKPNNLGVKEGSLAACPASPNCVVSQNGDEEHTVAPIAYTSDRATARQNLIDILGVVPRTEIVERSDSYILAKSESRLMGFVDDTEFYLPEGENIIHARAAARLGESDLGVNRRRIEQVRLAFQDLAQRQNP